MFNPERVYLERAVEEAELDRAYDWFYENYTVEEQEALLESFESNPVQFVKEAWCAV